jgi:hypothetical protein
VICVEYHAADAFAHFGEARTCPTLGAESPVQRTQIHRLKEFVLVILGGAFSWSWMGFGTQGICAANFPGGVPNAHSGAGHVEFASDAGLA